MKRWAEIWSSFPAAHKQRCYQGLAAYGLLTLVIAVWIGARANSTIKNWQDSVPSATVVVKNVYVTPQITDASKEANNHGTDISLLPAANAPVVDDGKTYISIIVSGLGLSSMATERTIDDLPPQVTLAFSPYGDDVQTWIKKARSAHHETLMLLPMESAAYPQNDPGPKALSSRFSDEDNDENLHWLLTQGAGSVGAMNLMGTRFLTDKRRLSSVFTTLRKDDDLFIETPGIDKSAVNEAASKIGLPYMEANLQIDAVATDRDIRKQLGELEQIARKHGYAVGIAEPYPLTLNILKSWASGLEAQGILLAPLRTVWKNKTHYEEDAPQPPPQSELKQP